MAEAAVVTEVGRKPFQAGMNRPLWLVDVLTQEQLPSQARDRYYYQSLGLVPGKEYGLSDLRTARDAVLDGLDSTQKEQRTFVNTAFNVLVNPETRIGYHAYLESQASLAQTFEQFQARPIPLDYGFFGFGTEASLPKKFRTAAVQTTQRLLALGEVPSMFPTGGVALEHRAQLCGASANYLMSGVSAHDSRVYLGKLKKASPELYSELVKNKFKNGMPGVGQYHVTHAVSRGNQLEAITVAVAYGLPFQRMVNEYLAEARSLLKSSSTTKQNDGLQMLGEYERAVGAVKVFRHGPFDRVPLRSSLRHRQVRRALAKAARKAFQGLSNIESPNAELVKRGLTAFRISQFGQNGDWDNLATAEARRVIRDRKRTTEEKEQQLDLVIRTAYGLDGNQGIGQLRTQVLSQRAFQNGLRSESRWLMRRNQDAAAGELLETFAAGGRLATN